MAFCPEFQFGIYLVDAAIAQLQFLRIVDDYPSLYAGPHVRNAIRRYAVPFIDSTKQEILEKTDRMQSIVFIS